MTNELLPENNLSMMHVGNAMQEAGSRVAADCPLLTIIFYTSPGVMCSGNLNVLINQDSWMNGSLLLQRVYCIQTLIPTMFAWTIVATLQTAFGVVFFFCLKGGQIDHHIYYTQYRDVFIPSGAQQ